jgi:hypothetical protein
MIETFGVVIGKQICTDRNDFLLGDMDLTVVFWVWISKSQQLIQ